MWIVEGGKYKASFLLDGAEGERLLISEVRIRHWAGMVRRGELTLL